MKFLLNFHNRFFAWKATSIARKLKIKTIHSVRRWWTTKANPFKSPRNDWMRKAPKKQTRRRHPAWEGAAGFVLLRTQTRRADAASLFKSEKPKYLDHKIPACNYINSYSCKPRAWTKLNNMHWTRRRIAKKLVEKPLTIIPSSFHLPLKFVLLFTSGFADYLRKGLRSRSADASILWKHWEPGMKGPGVDDRRTRGVVILKGVIPSDNAPRLDARAERELHANATWIPKSQSVAVRVRRTRWRQYTSAYACQVMDVSPPSGAYK
jgi:hypothetical protein